jgi:MinD superfamily P-loop ATPase
MLRRETAMRKGFLREIGRIMKIAVASGKGGTGKTTIAVGLALAASGEVTVLDCDVEAPNCHIFLKPQIICSKEVNIPVPVLEESLCDGCGKCGDVCEYRAIAIISGKPMIFSELCHGCGACTYICPRYALRESPRNIGIIEKGNSLGIGFVHGLLNIGEPISPPLIKAVKKEEGDGLTIIDCPPGTSCPVVTAVAGSDYVILVTEPTPFGLNDLKLAVEMLDEMDIPYGVVINKAGTGDLRVKEFCSNANINVLSEIPDNRRAAVAYSRGLPTSEIVPEFRGCFEEILHRVMEKKLNAK